MLRKIISILLCAALVMSCAFAAPVRDKRNVEGETDMLDTFVSLIAGGALMRAVPSYTENEQPPQKLVEGALVIGLYRFLLPRDENSADMTDTLTEADLAAYYQDIFASGSFIAYDQPTCSCISKNGSSYTFDYSDLEGNADIGAYIYNIESANGLVHIDADVFSAFYSGLNADDIPEDSLWWECGISMTVKADASSRFGYKLVSFEFTPAYNYGALYEWTIEGTEMYELVSPFAYAGSDINGETYVNEDGSASVLVHSEVLTGTDKLNTCLEIMREQHPDGIYSIDDWADEFTVELPGAYIICFVPESMDKVYTLTLTFPTENQEEYTLYGEFIRNSFWASGMALG